MSLKLPYEKQLLFVFDTDEYQQDYNSWPEAIKSLKAIGGNYTFDNERTYINRKVLEKLKSLPGARLEWKVVFAVSDVKLVPKGGTLHNSIYDYAYFLRKVSISFKLVLSLGKTGTDLFSSHLISVK